MTSWYESFIPSLLHILAQGEFLSRKFAVYGLGVVAQKVLETISGRWAVAGLMDRDAGNTGKVFYGFQVISEEEFIERADCVIIAANDMHWRSIARRIAYLRDVHGKTILYTNGETALPPVKQETRPHGTDWAGLQKKIEECPVVCFDVFDTLITRRLAEPADIFLYVEKSLGDGFPFSLNRKAAEDQCCREIGDAYTIDDIYRRLGEQAGLSQDQTSRLLKAELAAEARFAAPKREMASVFFQCLGAGKRVYLVSDMYLYAVQIERILLSCGISGQHGLFVSSELGATKAAGTIWPRISAITGDDFVHIGDDERADIRPLGEARKTFHAPNHRDRLSMCGWGHLNPHVRNWEDSLALGLLMARLFGDKGDGFEAGGRPLAASPYNFGYLFFGPLLLGFIIWMIGRAKAFRPRRVYFPARDGHLLVRLYNEIISISGLDAPEPVYLKTSRRAAAMAGIRDEDDILVSLKQPFSATISAILHNRFGIAAQVEDDETLPHTDWRLRREILKYKDMIIDKAKSERDENTAYLARIGMSDKAPVLLCDYGTSATTQFWLEKVLNRPLFGLYLTAVTGEHNLFGIGARIEAFFPQQPFSKEAGAVYRFQPLLDAILTAPGGSIKRVFSDGRVEAACPPERRFDLIHEIHEGIIAYAGEYLTLAGRAAVPSKELAEAIFALIGEGGCAVSDEIKNLCLYENAFLGQTEERRII